VSSARPERITLAAALRSEFDRSFAQPHRAEPPQQQDLLVIRVAEHDYAVSLDEVVALHADRKIVPIPSPHAALLGLVGLRGSVLPVYDLRQLLGYPKGTTPARWVLSVRAPAPFAVSFDQLEAHLRLPRAELLSPHAADAAAAAFTRGSVSTELGPRPLLDLTTLFAVALGSDQRIPRQAPEVTR
jgi:purine-binding chemotaxis protein CheW